MNRVHVVLGSVVAGCCLAVPFLGAGGEEGRSSPAAEGLRVPPTVEREHEELHAELKEIIASGGKTGTAAEAVSKTLHAHFHKENELAMPPLGLLPSLASGKEVPAAEAREVVAMTDRLKAELPQMLEEHRQVVQALEDMKARAKEENNAAAARFADDLIQHARTEEEILYPAAILVGEYLKQTRDH